jgi:hypothetical protein
MSLKLRLASLWLPSFLIKKELDHVADVTIGCLDQLLLKYKPDIMETISRADLPMDGNLDDHRRIMAHAHNGRVESLIEIMGYENAVKIGRKYLFKAGLKLGREARKRLIVNDDLPDLVRAARVLYRVLGIEFEIEYGDEVTIIVSKCCLSNYYTPETCRILSAADEGVVQGLNENIHMKFTQRMTDGPSECLACIYSDNAGN